MIRLVSAPAQTGSQLTDARPAQASAAPDVPIEDWDLLFRAVQDRLTQLADKGAEPGSAFKDAMLDCIRALDQLRVSMLKEFSQCQPGSSARTG